MFDHSRVHIGTVVAGDHVVDASGMRGWVRVDGNTVEDPAFPATPPSQVELKVILRRADRPHDLSVLY